MLSVALLPIALALVWFHRYVVSYRSSDFDADLDVAANEPVHAQAMPPPCRYIPPKAPRDRDYAVSVLSEAGF
jgi:hypothetical protein